MSSKLLFVLFELHIILESQPEPREHDVKKWINVETNTFSRKKKKKEKKQKKKRKKRKKERRRNIEKRTIGASVVLLGV